MKHWPIMIGDCSRQEIEHRMSDTVNLSRYNVKRSIVHEIIKASSADCGVGETRQGSSEIEDAEVLISNDDTEIPTLSVARVQTKSMGV